MLLAVEGGGFFSSSASGYSKGLTLLLLGQRSEEKPMRVSPWNQYQLVDQESEPELQLASTKNRLSRGCASFVCFGRASAGPETPSPLKVGPAQQHDALPGPLVSNKDQSAHLDDNSDTRKVVLKSSLKRPQNNKPVPVQVANEHEASDGKRNDAPGQIERRKVQWTDACGSELIEIREFEPSYYIKWCKEHLGHWLKVKWMDQMMNLTMGMTELVRVQLCKIDFPPKDDLDPFARHQMIHIYC